MIAIPHRMRRLPLDRRGLPVPVIVMWTESGEPLFAANDENRRQQCFAEDRCHICGGALLRGRWFVGGTLSTSAVHGVSLDGPMHDECAHYALAVCPYLAAPRYGRLVGAQQLRSSDRADVVVVATGTESNPRPELFVALMAVAQEYSHGSALPGVAETEIIYGVRPKPGSVRKVEVWRHGRQIIDRFDLDMMLAEARTACVNAGDTMRVDVANLWCLP